MSIVTLLADFPNYSARKVRRLAKQISFITSMQNEIGPVEPAIVRGIEQDLIEFNLLQAKTEEQLNDDLGHPSSEAVAKAAVHPDQVTERINVCPTAAARRAVDEYRNWIIQSVDITGLGFDHIDAKCRGIISGQSFYTDRTFIQAKLSPQDNLPLDSKS